MQNANVQALSSGMLTGTDISHTVRTAAQSLESAQNAGKNGAIMTATLGIVQCYWRVKGNDYQKTGNPILFPDQLTLLLDAEVTE